MKYISLSALILLMQFSFAQPVRKPEHNQWYFGNNCALDFNNGAPQFINNSSQVAAIETAGSICDANGNILMSSEGARIYDRNQNPMPNGNVWASQSARLGPMFVPWINNPGRYHVFQVDGPSATFSGNCGPNGRWDGLYYHEVDMALNNGNGDIIPGRKNMVLTDSVGEGVVGIMHENGEDYWIVVRKAKYNAFYAFLVTQNGVCTTPVISNAGTVGYQNPGLMSIAASFDGRQIATAESYSRPQLFDFDRCTGVISNARNINAQSCNSYDVAFSPNDSLIYVTLLSGTASPYMYQYQRYAPNIPASRHTIFSGQTWGQYPNMIGYLGMRVYGDTLYIGNADSSLHMLTTPNTYAAPGLVNHAIYLGQYGKRMSYHFPNYFDYQYEDKPRVANDTTVCNGDSVYLGGPVCSSPGYTFTWAPATGLNASNIANPKASPSQTTTYVLTINFLCETWTDTVTVNVGTVSVQAGPDVTICAGDSVQIGGAPTGPIGSTTIWDNGLSLSDSTVGNPMASPSVTTPYIVAVTNNGCTARDTALVHVVTAYSINSTVSICPGDSIWTGSSYAHQPGLYVDSLQAISGCDSVITTNVNPGVPVTSNIPQSVCLGDSLFLEGRYRSTAGTYTDTIPGGSSTGCDSVAIVQLSIVHPATGFAQMEICSDDFPIIGGVTVMSEGVYTETIPAGAYTGCDSIVSYTVTYKPDAVLAIEGVTDICEGETTLLSASGGENYQWSNGVVGESVVVRADENMEVSVVDTSVCGAPQTGIELSVKRNGTLYIPNTFTPNGDGQNDHFFPKFTGVESLQFMVFDRWGAKIFESSDTSDKWDGRYQGEVVPTSMFTYRIIGEFTCGGLFDKLGHVTILK